VPPVPPATQRAKAAEGERNRTALAQMNAEIRREKAKLKAQIPDLQKMAKKKARSRSRRQRQPALKALSDADALCVSNAAGTQAAAREEAGARGQD
jgi:hypothetical protein